MQKTIALIALFGLVSAANADAPLKAEYRFQNNLSSSVAGAPDIEVIDPLGESGFFQDQINGNGLRTTYKLEGAPGANAGFVLDTGGLVISNSYSVELAMRMKVNRIWQKLVDSNGLQSDGGLYWNSDNILDIPPNALGNFYGSIDMYMDVILTVNANQVGVYVNGNNTGNPLSTSVMNISAPDHKLRFFLDDMATNQTQFGGAAITGLRLYEGVMSRDQISRGGQEMGITPEPAPWMGFGVAFGGFLLRGWFRKRARRSVKA